MLKVIIKRLIDKKWQPIPVDEVVDKSLVDWIDTAEGILIAALYEDEKPVAFISNNQHYVDMYKEKGFSMLASDLQKILLPSLKPVQLVADIFENATVKEIRQAE